LVGLIKDTAEGMSVVCNEAMCQSKVLIPEIIKVLLDATNSQCFQDFKPQESHTFSTVSQEVVTQPIEIVTYYPNIVT